MEGKVNVSDLIAMLLLSLIFGLFLLQTGYAQESPRDRGQKGPGELTFRKTAQLREYQGRDVEGEERRVGPGDSIWRILIKERGLPEQRFSQYLVIIRGLNPKIKNDVLRVGDNIFVPLRPDELLVASSGAANPDLQRSPSVRGATKEYRVKRGEHLYQILREQLGISNDREVALYYALVKDLNPERSNWDELQGGDIIRLPFPEQAAETSIAERKSGPAIEPKPPETIKEFHPPSGVEQAKQEKPPARVTLGLDYAKQLPAKENLALLGQVVESLGNEVRRDGQETLTLKEGTVRVDRTSYPVVYDPKLQQRIILDPEEKIPASLKSKLTDRSIQTAVFPLTRTASLQESVSQLLARLGYQSLPTDRPVVIQEGGVAIEARGNWMALAPQQSNNPQEIFVIALTDDPQDIPDYLRKELSTRGMQLKDVLLTRSPNPSPEPTQSQEPAPAVKYWPREKRELVDAVLLSFSVPFGVSEVLPIKLGDGLRVDVSCDRIFERNGRRTGLFFQPLAPEIKKVLEEKEKMKIIELDLAMLDHKGIMASLLRDLGEPAAYREHQFSASTSKDRLNIKAWGFLLAKRGMFVTDREIPQSLHRFFFEKGLEIVYF